jgi:hypothetical protein
METISYENLVNVLTKERLSSYKFADNDGYSIILERRLYNMKVSQAFYPLLSLIEVTLRKRLSSAVHNTIKRRWLLDELLCQDILKDKEYKILQEAEKKLKRSHKTISSGSLISELSLGFWVHLCTKQYKIALWDRKDFFPAVFPNYPNPHRMDKLNVIYPYLYNILKLRNRIFHHEIIVNNKNNITSSYLQAKEVLSYLSSEAAAYLNSIDDFQNIVKQKP